MTCPYCGSPEYNPRAANYTCGTIRKRIVRENHPDMVYHEQSPQCIKRAKAIIDNAVPVYEGKKPIVTLTVYDDGSVKIDELCSVPHKVITDHCISPFTAAPHLPYTGDVQV